MSVRKRKFILGKPIWKTITCGSSGSSYFDDGSEKKNKSDCMIDWMQWFRQKLKYIFVIVKRGVFLQWNPLFHPKKRRLSRRKQRMLPQSDKDQHVRERMLEKRGARVKTGGLVKVTERTFGYTGWKWSYQTDQKRHFSCRAW